MVAMTPIVYYNGESVTADANLRVYWRAFSKVVLWVQTTALTGSPSAATLDVKIQHKFPREGSVWLDVSGAAITQVTQADATTDQFIALDEDDLNTEDMRIVVDTSFTGGTSPGWTVNMSAEARL